MAAGTTVVHLIGEYVGRGDWGVSASEHGAESLTERRSSAKKYFDIRETGNRAVNDDGNYVYFKNMGGGKYSVVQETPDGVVVGATDNMTIRQVTQWANEYGWIAR